MYYLHIDKTWTRFLKVVLPQLRSFFKHKMFYHSIFHVCPILQTLSFSLPFLSLFSELVIQNPHLFIYFILNHNFLQVTDINGVDVTPRPLYRPDPHSSTGKPNKLLTSQDGSHTSDFIASYSLYQNTINPSMLGQFTR